MVDNSQPVSGYIEDAQHFFPLRVYFEDTDISGIAYHANYLRWCERARSEILRLIGIDQRGAWEGGEGAYAVAEANCKFRKPARLGDALLIITSATELRAASCRLNQCVMRDQQLLAELDVRIGFVTPEGRPRRQPEEWRQAFQIFEPKVS